MLSVDTVREEDVKADSKARDQRGYCYEYSTGTVYEHYLYSTAYCSHNLKHSHLKRLLSLHDGSCAAANNDLLATAALVGAIAPTTTTLPSTPIKIEEKAHVHLS